MKSQDYFTEREKTWQERQIKDDKFRMAEIKKQLQYAQGAIQREIDAQWGSSSDGQRTTHSEAMRHVSRMDVKVFTREAKKYVEERGFPPTADKELKLYNLIMRVSRLELLKANVRLRSVTMFGDLDKYLSGELTKAGLKEL